MGTRYEHAMARLGSGVTWTCALSTSALFVVAIGLALHVRLGFGHWPTPMWENYRATAYDLHEGLLIGIAFFAIYAAAPRLVAASDFDEGA